MQEMIMWTGVLIFSLVLFVLAAYFLIKEISKLNIIKNYSKNNEKTAKSISAIVLIVLIVILSLIFTFTNCVIILIHFCLFTLLIKLIVLIIYKKYLDKVVILSFIFTSIYLGISFYNLYNVKEVTYSLKSDKLENNLRVVMFSDSHIGTSFSGKGLLKYVEEINKTNPDIVVIVGDLIDDATSKKDMEEGIESLSNLNTKYGTYYVFGNHDKGYYSSKRGYGEKELRDKLNQNNIKVLEDEVVLINDDFYLVGRADKSNSKRIEIENLVNNLDKDKYKLVLDHQPNDYQNESKSKVDLVLSGHTHGGQMFPIGPIGELIGANDFTYGYTKIDESEFIVSSGISDWEIQFKSFCGSEYLIINIENN